MKIVKVSSEVFDVLWIKMMPSQRICGDVPHPCIIMPFLNTLVVLNENISVLDFAPESPVDKLGQFVEWVRKQP